MNFRVRFVLALIGALASCEADFTEEAALSQFQSPVVYGIDNRLDVYAYPDPTWRARAAAAHVALVHRANINTSNPNNVTFSAPTLQAARNLCLDQAFLNQQTAAFCSGTLIDDDKVLTAGHCIRTAKDCSNTRFVFNYFMDSATVRRTITTADIFSCKQILARSETTTVDFAVVLLDRPATPRFEPAPVRKAASALASHDPLMVIGCPSGIPLKLDDGGSVRDPRGATLDYFVANTDTFGGNSGSGVYLTSTGEVAGILVRGETDYVYYGAPDYCYRVKVCPETGCRGEDSTYVFRALNAVCTVAPSPRLCPWCGDGTCNGAETTATCPADCGTACGDGVCNGGETSATCPADCPASFCGDGRCAGFSFGENCKTCLADCPCIGANCKKGCCGDGQCSTSESASSCPVDCS